MSRFLNADRREDVYWAGALHGYLNTKTPYYKGAALKWLESSLLSLECFLNAVLKDVEPKEARAIKNMVQDLTPTIRVNSMGTDPQRVTVNADLLYDMAEIAVEICKYECKGNFDTCRRREMFLGLGIPPYVEQGVCQYWRGEEWPKF